MSTRVYNFSAGPAVLPTEVLEEAQVAVRELPGVGSSILEISHRSKAFDAVLAESESLLRELLAVPAGYKVIFLQGGSSLQFSMVPMNLLRGTGKTADYILTGSWGKKAFAEAQREGTARAAWDGKADGYNRLPSQSELKLTSGAAYVHMTSNETIQGVEFPAEPDTEAPLVCDASSNFLSRPVDVNRYGLIYACAKERGHCRRDGRHHPRRVARAGARGIAADAGLPAAGRKRLALQHAPGVRHLRDDAHRPLAEERCRRAGQDGRA